MASARVISAIRDAVVITTIVGALFVAIEGSVRAFWPQNLRTEYVGGASTAVPDDQLGHRLRPHARSRVSGPEFAVEYVHNGEGLRDEARHALPKPEGTTRILVLGDSFAYGAGNDYQESWPVLFERRLLADGYPVDVVKAGVPGYDTRTEALYLERIFTDYDPDIVLLTFLPNDLFTNGPFETAGGETRWRPIPDPGGRRQRLRSAQPDPRQAPPHGERLAVRQALPDDQAPGVLRHAADRHPAPTDRGHQGAARAGAELLRAEGTRSGGPLDSAAVSGARPRATPRRWAWTWRRSTASSPRSRSEQGFTWLPALPRLRELYRADAEDLFFRFDGHLNNRGNRAVADYLAAVLLERFADELQHPGRPLPAGSV